MSYDRHICSLIRKFNSLFLRKSAKAIVHDMPTKHLSYGIIRAVNKYLTTLEYNLRHLEDYAT